MRKTNFLLIAEIIALYGKNGFLKIELFHSNKKIILNLNEVFIDFFGKYKLFTVEDLSETKNGFIIKFVNFFSEEECSLLIGRKIYVDEKKVPKLKTLLIEGFSFLDLTGSNVYRNGKISGTITGVFSSPANDIIEIKVINGQEILIPLVDEFIESFNPDDKKLTLKPGGDLFYDED